MVGRGGVRPSVSHSSGVSCTIGVGWEVTVGVVVGGWLGLVGTFLLGVGFAAAFAKMHFCSTACWDSGSLVTGSVLPVFAAAKVTCLANIESADSFGARGVVLASVVDYTKRSLPFSVAVTIRCARLVIPLEDGVGGTTVPVVVLLTMFLV
jgi:hypothetical protein